MERSERRQSHHQKGNSTHTMFSLLYGFLRFSWSIPLASECLSLTPEVRRNARSLLEFYEGSSKHYPTDFLLGGGVARAQGVRPIMQARAI